MGLRTKFNLVLLVVQREANRAQDTTELYSLLAKHLPVDDETQGFLRDAALQ